MFIKITDTPQTRSVTEEEGKRLPKMEEHWMEVLRLCGEVVYLLEIAEPRLN